MTTSQLDTIELKNGGHRKREDGMCFMEAVAYIKGLPHSDSPSCTDPVVAAYARALNDLMPDDQRQRLKPLILRAAETPNGVAPVKRAMLCADYAVRVFAVAALKDAGLDSWADQLATLDEVKDEPSARAAGAAAWAAWAAGATAWAARAAGATAWAAGATGATGATDPWAKPIELLEKLLDMHEALEVQP